MEFRTYQVNFLPMAIINKVWRWQYLTRKRVARAIKLYFYELNREHTKINNALWR
jgi:hypothetical protein